MRKIFVKMFSIILIMTLVVVGTSIEIGSVAYAEDVPCDYIEGSNVGSQNYTVRSSPVYSYLTVYGSGYMRVQGNSENGEVAVEYYDSNYCRTGKKTINEELPIFGGFHESENNYFIVTGQTNPNELDSVEVFRITKYDKNWNRISSGSVFGANTTIPFRAGNCRMADFGNVLIVRTCHQMYKSSDGKNHQANVMLQLNIDTMELVDSFTGIGNVGKGYVSHSFNQFVKIQNNKIWAVDHGDAYPRSFVLINYPTDISQGTFLNKPCYYKDIMTFPGEIGDNTTGASVGGFEISNSAYLIAGNSVVQDEKYAERSTRNIFLIVATRKADNNEIAHINTDWITDYKEDFSKGDDESNLGASTPHLVKVSDNKYILMWTAEGELQYLFIDGNGNKISNIYRREGGLSDCVPIVKDEALVWYVWNGKNIDFYSISISNPENFQKTSLVYDHDYERTHLTSSEVTLTCSKCGDVCKNDISTDPDYLKMSKVVWIRASSVGKNKIRLSWNNISGESGYEIYKSRKRNKSYTLAKRVSGTKVKSVKLKIKKRKMYYFKVRAYKRVELNGKEYKVRGAWSPVLSCKLY